MKVKLNSISGGVIIYRIVYGVLSETLPCQQTRKARRIRFYWTKPPLPLWVLNRRVRFAAMA